VVAFALLSDILQPKSFSGLFSAAPSIAMASLLITALASGHSKSSRCGRWHDRGRPRAWSVTASSRRSSSNDSGRWRAARSRGRLGSRRSRDLHCVTSMRADTAGLALMEVRSQAIPRDYVIRFAFGAVISAVAAAVAIVIGARIGGALLAFAICRRRSH